MGATILKHANAMPAPTWHRLHTNDVDIELPEELTVGGADAGTALELAGAAEAGPDDAFERALGELQERLDAARALEPADARAVLRAAEGSADPGDLDVPALSACEARSVQKEAANQLAEAFECGLGPEADAWIEQTAAASADEGARAVVVCGAGRRSAVALRLAGTDGRATAATLDLVAQPHSEVSLSIEHDSPEGGEGATALKLRVFAGAGAHVAVEAVQTLDDGWTALDDSGYVLDEGAHVEVTHRVLGAKASYTGLAADLRGDGCSIDIDTRYLGHGSNLVDFNYVVRHHGKKTSCKLDANGVLLDESKKTLRGTIDLVHGCKGSEGSERDTVLLADERAQNKTVPVILCDEDDVAGNHGATIGHVRPEQLNYLQSRGLSPKAAEGLFATAVLEEAAAYAPSAAARAGVARIASGLAVPFDADREE